MVRPRLFCVVAVLALPAIAEPLVVQGRKKEQQRRFPLGVVGPSVGTASVERDIVGPSVDAPSVSEASVAALGYHLTQGLVLVVEA
jgi:hypothetical protein